MSTASRLARVTCAIAALAFASVPRAAHAKPFQIGAGLIGVAGGNFQDKPDRSGLQPDVNPGFGGPTIGGGLMVDARFLDGLLGLEVDAMRTSDHGNGSIKFSSPAGSLDAKITIGQPAWHIPILAKVTIDVPIVAPAFYVGPEIVLPSVASTSVDPSLLAGNFSQTSDTYVMVTFGVGVEIKLPLPILDLRIPIGLRGGFAPGVSSDFADRTNVDPIALHVTYRSEWKFQAAATLGAAVYF